VKHVFLIPVSKELRIELRELIPHFAGGHRFKLIPFFSADSGGEGGEGGGILSVSATRAPEVNCSFSRNIPIARSCGANAVKVVLASTRSMVASKTPLRATVQFRIPGSAAVGAVKSSTIP
jgi:hypothetical protein